LKHLGSSSHYVESLPAPSSLQSSSEHQQHLLISNYENASSIDDGREVIEEERRAVESFHSSIHHALSTTTNSRHRRSLASAGDRRNKSNFKRHLIKRYIVKRNFPNNQLTSKSSDETDEDDSNELELGESDDDYTEHEQKQPKSNVDGQHDRLEEGDNKIDSDKSIKMFVPYWDAYDTVNQLFLEMGKLFYLHM
jgi:hypothetical protein